MKHGGNIGIISQPLYEDDIDINTVRKSIDGLAVAADCRLESIDRTDINDI